MNPLLELCDAIAAEAHFGQVDKLGVDYVEHPRAVARAMAMAGAPPEDLAVALLHDVLEDSSITSADLVLEGVPQELVLDVMALTFRYFDDAETRAEYYARVRKRPRALRVKRADVAHNKGRLDAIEDLDTRNRLEKKYAKAELALA